MPRFGQSRTGSLAVMVGAALMFTTACGGQSLATEQSSSGPKVAAELEPAPKEELAADVINAIQPNPDLLKNVPQSVVDKGLRMTTSEGYPPMEMFATDGESLLGVDPALGRAISRKLGVKITIANQDFNAQIPGITTGRFDMIMSGMTDNAVRRETVTFVDYASAGHAFVVRKGNPSGIKVPGDLCGKTASVIDNGASLKMAEQYSADCAASGAPAVTILKFPGEEATMQVENGRADAAINDYPVAAYRAKMPGSVLDAVPIEGEKSPMGIAMKPDNKDLIASVQAALEELIKDGSYRQILDAWGVGDMAVTTAAINDGK